MAKLYANGSTVVTRLVKTEEEEARYGAPVGTSYTLDFDARSNAALVDDLSLNMGAYTYDGADLRKDEIVQTVNAPVGLQVTDPYGFEWRDANGHVRVRIVFQPGTDTITSIELLDAAQNSLFVLGSSDDGVDKTSFLNSLLGADLSLTGSNNIVIQALAGLSMLAVGPTTIEGYTINLNSTAGVLVDGEPLVVGTPTFAHAYKFGVGD